MDGQKQLKCDWLSSFDLQEVGAFFKGAQHGKNDETENEYGKPDGVNFELLLDKTITDQIQQKKHANDQEKAIIFASGNCTPGEWKW